MKRLMISFDEQQLAWLDTEATKLGLTKSLLVKKALDWYISQYLVLAPSSDEIYCKDKPLMSKYINKPEDDIPF